MIHDHHNILDYNYISIHSNFNSLSLNIEFSISAGGIYHFRDQIRKGNPSNFFVMNADVCCDFPLQAMLNNHVRHG